MGRDDEERMAAGSDDLETTRAGGRSGATVAIVGLIIALGLTFWAMSDRGATTTASNRSAATTTGASPSNPPPVRSPAGQGESNSTR
jgi:hypothetical protein